MGCSGFRFPASWGKKGGAHVVLPAKRPASGTGFEGRVTGTSSEAVPSSDHRDLEQGYAGLGARQPGGRGDGGCKRWVYTATCCWWRLCEGFWTCSQRDGDRQHGPGNHRRGRGGDPHLSSCDHMRSYRTSTDSRCGRTGRGRGNGSDGVDPRLYGNGAECACDWVRYRDDVVCSGCGGQFSVNSHSCASSVRAVRITPLEVLSQGRGRS